MHEDLNAGVERRLAVLDAELAACAGTLASLAPGRDSASSLVTIATSLLSGRSSAWEDAFASSAERVVRALIEHFPGNLYWDLDYLLAALLEEAAAPEGLLEAANTVARLQALFGCHSKIAFRYLHDFTYGFDWARWSVRRPAEREGIGPFSPLFLAHLEQRGREITAAIDAGDERFPRLSPGTYRNPFPFSRKPFHERLLLEDLAARNLVPIHTWSIQARPRNDLPFSELREERARALAIPPEMQPAP